MFYRLGFRVVQRPAAEAHAIERLDHAAGQRGQRNVLDALGQLAPGGDGKLEGRLACQPHQAATRQHPFEPADHFALGPAGQAEWPSQPQGP